MVRRDRGSQLPQFYDPKQKRSRKTGFSMQKAAITTVGVLVLIFLLFRRAPSANGSSSGSDGSSSGIGRGGSSSSSSSSKDCPPGEKRVCSFGRSCRCTRQPTLTSRSTVSKIPPEVTQRLQEEANQRAAARNFQLSPQYRGPGKQQVHPQFANANRVLLSTHNRLMWYRYDTDELHVIHEGEVSCTGAVQGWVGTGPAQVGSVCVVGEVGGLAVTRAARWPAARHSNGWRCRRPASLACGCLPAPCCAAAGRLLRGVPRGGDGRSRSA
jgi:hypothetical protein